MAWQRLEVSEKEIAEGTKRLQKTARFLKDEDIAACLLNAARCGRVHCRYMGPFFILAAVTSLAYGLGLLPLGPSGWKWIGAGTVIGALVLCCIPELFIGRYRRWKNTAA